MEHAMNLKESGRFTGLSPHTLRAKARRRELAFYRVGRRMIFDKRDLEDFLSRHRIEPCVEVR